MGDVIVASTTDDQNEVNAAAGGKPQNEELAPEKAAPTGNELVESQEIEQKETKEPIKETEEKTAPKNLSKKFDKLYKENKELQERLKALETPKVEPENTPIPVEVAAKFDTFDAWSEKQINAGKSASLDDFLEERDNWKEARDAQKAERAEAQAAQQQIETTYQERVDEFAAEHPDWKEVVGESDLTVPPAAGAAIKELDNGPAVVWHLATHPEETRKFNQMSPIAAVAYIGKLSAKLERPAVEETQTNNTSSRSPDRQPIVSRAPAPLTPLKGGGIRPTKDLSSPEISYEDYRKIRDEQAKTRFRR